MEKIFTHVDTVWVRINDNVSYGIGWCRSYGGFDKCSSCGGVGGTVVSRVAIVPATTAVKNVIAVAKQACSRK